ncbi:metallophosphoesterase family protein [Hydrogenophaga sp. UC242_50]|uniref:metallophosphoesterase family protein n=1 Tax=unclassified Hydrogenophaga TaxID=2610897 RepID=UPI0036D2DBF3
MEDADGHDGLVVEAVFAVLGDPHFAHAAGARTHLKIKPTGELASESPKQNPWAGLNDLVATQSLTADAVLCPGDIAFQNDGVTLAAGWKHLVDLGKRLQSEHVLCATGNHDVTSRSQEAKIHENVVANLKAGLGPFEPLKVLKPPYPSVTRDDDSGAKGRDHRVRYFGAGLVLVEAEKYQVLIVNSCSEHGHDKFEHERGTFPKSAVSELELALQQCDHRRISIAIMHHPPEPHTQNGEGAHDFIDNGQELLRLLSEDGNWLVIHGHKHEARLGFASGNGEVPFVFGAASLAFYISELEGTFQNQFYLLTVRLDSRGISGRFRTWDWAQGKGWQPAVSDGNSIYDGASFGARDPGRVIAEIAKLKELPMPWSDVIKHVPEASLLTPESRNHVKRQLDRRHSLNIHADRDGHWLTLERKAL